MLDSETKRRIDSARDILVGKVPDPKSQVEQITIALIYKFMDDMDAEAEELGGKRSFFVGEYEKFSWAKLLSPALSGYDMLNLYGESIDKMTRNQGVPQLFRDIFKNAYLPYRDPETLKMFLKVINDFNYDHSEKLGDAFEYLLSVLGSQGDAGQFRTPRHIIDFMVKVLDPQKEDSILDPACGTAGFLISAYKHIINNNTDSNLDPKGFKKPLGSVLTPTERKKLADNIRGYDISPDMVRLSLVNLYLHGFTTPNIFEYDTLASEERWNDTADVILANPPFMSPKGGIMPHKKFSVQSNRSEVLFVDYMAEHLTPNGRAAIIVPEGIIFQSAGAYKQLRKYLIEHNFLWAVVSLPAGAFNPYSGVKTSILFLDRSLAKKTDKVLFVKVANDGFDLGAQRRPIDRNDLPETLKVLKEYQQFINQTLRVSSTIKESDGKETLRVSPLDENLASFAPKTDSALLVSISKLEESDYNLSVDRYREVVRVGKQTYPLVTLKDICEINPETAIPAELFGDTEFTYVDISSVENGSGKIDYNNKLSAKDAPSRARRLIKENDVLLSTVRPNLKAFAFIKNLPKKSIASTGFAVLRATKRILPEYLYAIIFDDKTVSQMIKQMGKGAYPSINQSDVESLQIPLPPLETQRQLVNEIAAHQRIIDGARQVVEGWTPDVEVDPEWEIKNLSEICETIMTGPFGTSLHESDYVAKGIPVINPKNIVEGIISTKNIKMVSPTTRNRLKEFTVHENDIVIGRRGEMGRCGIVTSEMNGWLCGTGCFVIRLKEECLASFAFLQITSPKIKAYLEQQAIGVTMKNLNQGILSSIQIPLPPLEIQREIVARIETERAIVHGNRELIRLYEEKVKKVIERVWSS